VVIRLTPMVGAAGLALLLLRMQRLLRPSLEGLDWKLAVGGALLAGIVVGMVSAGTKARWAFVALTAAAASLLLDLRLAVPGTLRVGMLPTLSSWQQKPMSNCGACSSVPWLTTLPGNAASPC